MSSVVNLDEIARMCTELKKGTVRVVLVCPNSHLTFVKPGEELKCKSCGYIFEILWNGKTHILGEKQ